MARLHEYQAKALLREHGFETPAGRAVGTPAEAEAAARDIAGPVVVKIQAWTTGRKAMGGVVFCDTPEQTRDAAENLLAMRVGAFPVEMVLVEQQLDIALELFVSLAIDDAARAPVLLLGLSGGSGVEERAKQVHRLACDVEIGPDDAELSRVLAGSPIDASLNGELSRSVRAVFETAKAFEARSLEINPLVTTKDGRVLAADCRMTIDDYAVFRHPELGIDIARELDHPPTHLERVAYDAEQADHRGTFYFAQLNVASDPKEAQAPARAPQARDHPLVGFHGAGGGGSMMSMDAITHEGFTIANFTDTSGNPSAAKVYRAARIILEQPGLVGYFGSGSGVASQEQFWSAYGLAKAFWELELNIPALIRLGGNAEDRAVEILESSCKELPATVEGYRKDDTPKQIAARFAELVAQSKGGAWTPRTPTLPGFVGSDAAFSFPITGGRVWIDTQQWDGIAPIAAEFAPGLLEDKGGAPALAVGEEDVAGKDSELIACEVECRRAGVPGLFVQLDIPGLNAEGAR